MRSPEHLCVYVQTFVCSPDLRAFMLRILCVLQIFMCSPDFRAFTKPFVRSWPDFSAFTRAFVRLCSDFHAFTTILCFYSILSRDTNIFLDFPLKKKESSSCRGVFLIDIKQAWGTSSVWRVKNGPVWLIIIQTKRIKLGILFRFH